MSKVVILKGKYWEFCIHSPKYWKTMRDPNEPPVIPYYKIKMKMPYGIYENQKKERYVAMGTYIFPFAVRYFKKIY